MICSFFTRATLLHRSNQPGTDEMLCL